MAKTRSELEARIRELEAAEAARHTEYVRSLELRVADLEDQNERWRAEAHRLSEMGQLALQKAELAMRATPTQLIPNARDDPGVD